jgi:hypothetical protein
MKLNPMKNLCKKLFLIPAMLAVLAMPVCALETNATDSATNQPTATTSTNEDAATVYKATPQRDNQNGIRMLAPDGAEINLPLPFSTESGFGKTFVALVAITSPFIFFIVIAVLFFTFRNHRNKILHETLRMMIDKGVAIPPELILQRQQMTRRRTRSDLRNGLMWLGAGIGIMFVYGKVGSIVALIGAAFFITWMVEKKDKNNDVPPAIN